MQIISTFLKHFTFAEFATLMACHVVTRARSLLDKNPSFLGKFTLLTTTWLLHVFDAQGISIVTLFITLLTKPHDPLSTETL